MILSFAAKNVRSIKDRVEFNLASSADTELRDKLITFGNESFPRFVSIYGNNGSGKSSLLISMLNLQNLVISNNVIQPKVPLLRTPHKLAIEEPTEYSITFVTNGIRYCYELTYNTQEIIKENLFYAPKGRMGKIFQRKHDKVTYPPQFAFLSHIVQDLMDSNRLILSFAANNTNNKEIRDAFLFIKDQLVIYLGSGSHWINYSAKKINENPEIKQRIISFMNENSINIEDIDVKEEIIPINMLSLPANMPEAIKQQILSNPTIIPKIKLKHSGFWLDLDEDSEGTKKLINFLCPLIDILETGKVFVCDEIERHLHPVILRKIIKKFIENRQTNAQFICTTHDIDLLDLSLLRRDQIWFTQLEEKENKTWLYSLADLKGIRKDENIKDNYLKGKYQKLYEEIQRIRDENTKNS